MSDAEQLNRIRELTQSLRKRLIEYRFEYRNKEMSTHVNAAEIVVSLMEFALEQNPRPIFKEEENWFNAGYYLDYVFPSSSQWSDIPKTYYKIVEEAHKINFFRSRENINEVKQ
jgi:hypothetical protein